MSPFEGNHKGELMWLNYKQEVQELDICELVGSEKKKNALSVTNV